MSIRLENRGRKVTCLNTLPLILIQVQEDNPRVRGTVFVGPIEHYVYQHTPSAIPRYSRLIDEMNAIAKN